MYTNSSTNPTEDNSLEALKGEIVGLWERMEANQDGETTAYIQQRRQEPGRPLRWPEVIGALPLGVFQPGERFTDGGLVIEILEPRQPQTCLARFAFEGGSTQTWEIDL